MRSEGPDGRKSQSRLLPAVRACLTAAALIVPTSVLCQEAVTIGGTVVEPGGRPVMGALAYLDSAEVETRTDSGGIFQIQLSGTGAHVLHLRKSGFAPKDLQFDPPDSLSGEINVGPLTLTPAPGPVLRVQGAVRDAVTGSPVIVVAVGLNGIVQAVSGAEGQFQFSADVEYGANVIEVHRIGYEPMADRAWLSDLETNLDLTIHLTPVPVQLAEVVVEGDRTILAFGRLADFYRRRREGLGRYITATDIERRRPFQISDMLATVSGIRVDHDQSGRAWVRTTRSLGACTPVVFVDGMRVRIDRGVTRLRPDGDEQTSWGLGIDDVAIPEHVAGIEIYAGPAQVPPQFNLAGSQCGAIVIWTK